MTDAYELVGSIRRNLTTISDHYDETLEPTSRGSIKMPTQAVEGQKMRYAPKAMKEAPPPIGLHILDARRDAITDLHFWAGFIMGNVRDTNNQALNVYIDGTDIHAMCRFVSTWVDKLVTDHPDDADNLATDAAKHARTLRNLALPDRRDWATLGKCPLPTEQGECGGQVRAYPDSNPYRNPECARCGTIEPIDVWMGRLLPEASDIGTAGDIISCVAMRAEIILSHDQLRQWASRGFIQRHGKDAKGRTLYSKGAVLNYATNQLLEVSA